MSGACDREKAARRLLGSEAARPAIKPNGDILQTGDWAPFDPERTSSTSQSPAARDEKRAFRTAVVDGSI
jgi:hypothetical protein